MNEAYAAYKKTIHGILLKEFDYRYSITRSGIIYSWIAQHGYRAKPKVISAYTDTLGYKKVTLIKNDGTITKTGVHRVLAAAYLNLNYADKKMTVNHKNGIKDDNRLRNLELMTIKENTRHYMRKLKVKPLGYNPKNKR